MTDQMRAVAVAAVTADRGLLPEQVEVVRTREMGELGVVAYVVHVDGRRVRGFSGARRRDGDGWRASGGWSSGDRDVPADAVWTHGGGWGSGRRGSPAVGVRGGWVNHPDAAVVRLVDPGGRVVEDRVEAGVAILAWTDELTTGGAVVEVVDASGAVLRRAPLT